MLLPSPACLVSFGESGTIGTRCDDDDGTRIDGGTNASGTGTAVGNATGTGAFVRGKAIGTGAIVVGATGTGARVTGAMGAVVTGADVTNIGALVGMLVGLGRTVVGGGDMDGNRVIVGENDMVGNGEMVGNATTAGAAETGTPGTMVPVFVHPQVA